MARRRAANDPGVRVELTPRQEEVLGLIAAGKTNGEIAGILGVTLDGAKWHVREIMARLGADSREDAVERWRSGRTLRPRLPGVRGWLSWPLAAGLGGVVAVVAGIAAIVAVTGRDDAPPTPLTPGSTPVAQLDQPSLSVVQEGAGWTLSVDRTRPVPATGDAALAVRWDNWPTEVALVEAATGRVAARWETGYRPTAVFRPSRNEVLISHHPIEAPDQTGEPVLLRFSLDDLESPPGVVKLTGRISYTVGITELALSDDERWLYYIATGYPECVDESQGFRDSRGCVDQRVGVLDLDDPGALATRHVVGNMCGGFEPDPGNPVGVLVGCSNTQHSPAELPQYFAVDAGGAEELSSPPGFLTYGANSALTRMEDGRLFGIRITEPYTDDQGLMLSVYSPPFEPPVNTDATKRWTIPGLASAVPLQDPGEALGVMRDGRLVAIDLDSGAVSGLAYGLEPSALEDWALVG